MQNAERLDSEIIYNRDFDYDYFGFKVRGGDGKVCMIREWLASLTGQNLGWCADPGEVIPAAHKWHGGGKASAHAHACCSRDT